MAQDLNTLCHRKSMRCMKVPLKSTEQIYLIFLVPAVISCLIYIVHFSSDLVVAIEHFKDNNPIWGSCTLTIIYAPALSYFMLTVSRPDWWMTDDDKVSKGILGWFGLQVCHLIGFVFFALYRYAGLIVLSIDAIKLTGDARLKTLNLAAAPAAIELYFFLQAWFQAAPQAVFQTYLLFSQNPMHRSYQSVTVQVLCILMSVVIMAMQTTSFQRFESQRLNGRKLPWAMWLKKYCVEELENIEERAPLQTTLPVKDQESKTNASSESVQPEDNEAKPETAVVLPQQQQPPSPQNESRGPLNRQISVTPPLPPKNAHVTPPPTPLRGITTVAPLPIPDLPAPPRPDSVYTESQQEANTEGNQQQPITDNPQSLKVPTRKYSEKGLEEDDPVGKCLSFLWWFFFILARVLAIVVAYEFYSAYVIATLTVHYVVMLIYLFYYAKYYDVITFFVNLWLGLVYIFSLIEYRVKFKYADKWTMPYYVFVIIQNITLTLTWFIHANWDGFWYTYVVYTICVCTVLCILSSAVYHSLYKPKKCRVYSS
ncbi:uncharacterized protein LOC116847406 isoform X1 [Odontomachus brunneus]|uniref:uncharacterized protein LOC116847406 isoform X1 n=1 Tax=Odontomachus brunneus TaxID=486640 RepID=UPI0013F190ED|nr:uncharacterized protein LOC116847406 isoform X1 [Odontomachus brunneus]XP_032678263.1 uncharacterized protein LOC116847406 isoform X1 [Odontomachus brunneus]XP_032678264.1 uncharacterized protein LOC116847406 isoform X1 [Odontomachus brunneus]